jgi:glycine dehydrogenase subunit 1
LNQIYDIFFCGAGFYNHYIPPVVNEITRRGEFYTSYTPYQAEISQGFLQAIFEYQSAMSNLTGMDASNASVYDGATALAESIIMAINITSKRKVLIIQPFNPDYLKVIETYSFSSNFTIEYITQDFISIKDDLANYATVIVQNPNFFGEILDLKTIVKIVKDKSPKTMIINLIIESTSLGLLLRPGNIGADIVCGEGQPLGLPLNFGGPGIGFITTKKKYMRKLPGRIVGMTKELFGEREGYTLTLQAREQHIRREKALSNICTNEALCMLSVLITLVSLGYDGLRKLAEFNAKQAYFLKKEIHELSGFEVQNFEKPIYNEFMVSCPLGYYELISDNCSANNICPPYLLTDRDKNFIEKGNKWRFDTKKEYILVCTTEKNSKDAVDKFLGLLQYISDTEGGQ